MEVETKTAAQYGQAYADWQLARKRSPWRRLIKGFYVRRLLTAVTGRTVDVGCGAGQILERLPPGSAGLEVNPVLVRELTSRGLDVQQVEANPLRIDLAKVPAGRFDTLVLSHVLEHFNDADRVLRQLLADAAERRIGRVVIVVPGAAGYASDVTHRTFVDRDYIERQGLRACEGFRLARESYFPGDVAWIGRYFTYHELMLVYDRENGS